MWHGDASAGDVMSRPLFVLALLALGARRAEATPRCPIELRGDPEVAAQIVAELDAFPDDGSPCVALAIACSARDGALVLALQDAIGGEAQRTFASAAGAAAFLISWSRRPVIVDNTDSAPATAVVATSAAPSAAPAAGWRVELGLGMAITGHNETSALQVVVARDATDHKLGLGARALTGWVRDEINFNGVDGLYYERPIDVGGQLFATYGYQRSPAPHVRFHLDFEAGGSILVQDTPENSLQLNGIGLYGGARVGLGVHAYAMELYAGAGVDALYQLPVKIERSPFGLGTVYGYPHFDVALRWTL